MDSEGEVQHFAKQGGEALNLDDNEGFNDSEEVDDVEDDEPAEAPKKDPSPPKPAQGQPPQKEVKGEKLENQPYDLAVDVNDSEEIESEEEDDEVNMNDVGRAQQNTGQTAGQV